MFCAGSLRVPTPSASASSHSTLPACIFAPHRRHWRSSTSSVTMGSMSTTDERQAADLQAETNGTDATISEQQLPSTAHEQQQSPSLTLLPIRHTKTVHLVRHGQGYHNVAGEAEEELYKSYDFLDAHLTAKGWEQCAALKKHINANRNIRPEVVIVSPLTRAMETASGAFGGPLWHEGDAELPLMAEVAGGKFSTAHPAISSRFTVPFVAYELCREHLGEHPCDKRRSVSEYKQEFPGVDFSQIETDEDVMWKTDVRETDAEIAERGYRFLQWVSQRPENEIAVVCHSSILHFMLSNFARDAAPAVQQDLRRLFANCELRTVVLSDSGSEGGLDRSWFHPHDLHKEKAYLNGAVNGALQPAANGTS